MIKRRKPKADQRPTPSRGKRPGALVKALLDSETQSDFVNALRAGGILPKRPARTPFDVKRPVPDPRSRRFGEF